MATKDAEICILQRNIEYFETKMLNSLWNIAEVLTRMRANMGFVKELLCNNEIAKAAADRSKEKTIDD